MWVKFRRLIHVVIPEASFISSPLKREQILKPANWLRTKRKPEQKDHTSLNNYRKIVLSLFFFSFFLWAEQEFF